jgi:hypothetical protein
MKRRGVRFMDTVPKDVRETCDRYGPQVIGTMLAGGLTPASEDLQEIYQTRESRNHARDWLTETTDIQDYRERWIPLRDLLLEIAVIVLIAIEIFFSVYFGIVGLREGQSQEKILSALQQSTETTSTSMSSVKDSLASLVRKQDESYKILKEESDSRLAEAAKTPALRFVTNKLPFYVTPFGETTPKQVSQQYEGHLMNIGTTGLVHGIIDVRPSVKDVTVTCTVLYQMCFSEVNSLTGYSEASLELGTFRARDSAATSIIVQYTPGRRPFDVLVYAHGDNMAPRLVTKLHIDPLRQVSKQPEAKK